VFSRLDRVGVADNPAAVRFNANLFVLAFHFAPLIGRK